MLIMPPPGSQQSVLLKMIALFLTTREPTVSNTAPVCACVMGNSAILHKDISSCLIEYSPALMPRKIISDNTSKNV